MNRRSFLQSCAIGLAAGSITSFAHARSDYPQKPIRFIVPTSAGGATDAVARLYGEHMGKALKQSFVVANMPGAATLLGIRHLIQSAPDGYTLGVAANTTITMPYVDKNSGYMPSDLIGVSNLAKSPMALVTSSESPYKSLDELVAAAKKSPGQISYASVGIGTTSHLPVELFAQAADIELMMVPYKGIALAIPDIVAGRVTMMIGTVASVGSLIESGKMRALAVTSDKRSPDLPDVPTFTELGYPDVQYELFLGLMAPANTPPVIIRMLSDAAEAAKQEPELQARLAHYGQELPTQDSMERFQEFLRLEEARMRRVIEKANISINH